uniref:Synemin, intermediate filament protein n=1 Tax=Astyanax mexicanus TaxID=7994 RepID=W5LAC5_ASTMX
MFHLRRPFESEKLQLQELNQRLGQYLNRAQLLEQENARLVAELSAVRQSRSGGERESGRVAELREMRRLVERLSLEKSRAEMEKEQLRREFQSLQALCSDQTSVSRGIGGELRDCEQQLRRAQHTNGGLEQRLTQLQHEYALLEDSHRKEVAHLRSQLSSRALPVLTEVHRAAAPAVSMEQEVEEYARHLSESWMETLEMYRQRMEEMEGAVREDQVKLEDFRRERAQYDSELNRLRAEVDKHSQVQLELEAQLMNMQENFRGDAIQYQIIIEELEQERNLLANTISEKLKEHQDLLQVKMGLGLEVAAYRALLEEEGRHVQMRSDQRARERIIDIKLPSQYTPRISTTQPEMRSHLTGYGVKYMEPVSSIRTSATSSHFDSQRPSRIVPITMSKHAQQSPAARRDMISFTKATQAAAAASAAKTRASASDRTKDVSQSPHKTSPDLPKSATGSKTASSASPTTEQKSVRVVSPPMMSLSSSEESHQKVVDEKYKRFETAETDHAKVSLKPSEEAEYFQKEVSKRKDNRDLKDSGNVGAKVIAGEEKILDSVSMEEIIEKVMKPAGLDTKLSSGSDSKITYHVEKTQQEDGSTKTQIVLQSKVEEDLDISDDSALEEFLSKGVTKVSLEDIEGTPTGSMIQNLLSLGLQGESLENKSVNVEIIEEPVESQSDEEGEVEIEETVEVMSKPYYKPSSMFFQIEEPESEHQATQQHENTSETVTDSEYGKRGSVQVQEVSREESLPYYSQGQETQEYFVSTPEDNLSESEEGGGFMSYGHYGVVDDLSDERYYQDEHLPTRRRYSDEDDSIRESPEYAKRDTFPQCIIEEEVRVSPIVQESMLEILKEESLDPREQLRGALEQLESTVSGSLKEELTLLTKAGGASDGVSVDIKKVEQAADNGTMTFVAELSVSQSLEESGLLEDPGEELSQEQVLEALRSSNPGLHQAISAGAGGGYTMRVSREEVQTEGMPWMTGLDETEDWSSSGSEVGKTEKVIKLGPNEQSFTFQMDFNNGSTGSTDLQEVDSQGQSVRYEAGVDEFLQTQMTDPSLKCWFLRRTTSSSGPQKSQRLTSSRAGPDSTSLHANYSSSCLHSSAVMHR